MQNLKIAHTRIIPLPIIFHLILYVYLFFWGNNVLFILRIPADVFVMSCMLFLPFDTKITGLLSAEDILRIWLSERAGVACYLPEVMDEVFLKRK